MIYVAKLKVNDRIVSRKQRADDIDTASGLVLASTQEAFKTDKVELIHIAKRQCQSCG